MLKKKHRNFNKVKNICGPNSKKSFSYQQQYLEKKIETANHNFQSFNQLMGLGNIFGINDIRQAVNKLNQESKKISAPIEVRNI